MKKYERFNGRPSVGGRHALCTNMHIGVNIQADAAALVIVTKAVIVLNRCIFYLVNGACIDTADAVSNSANSSDFR